jgi:PIN domain nuclease of toxin-antitoxin system
MILDEPGGERVNRLLDEIDKRAEVKVAVSSVNWCEVLTRMRRTEIALTGLELQEILAGVEVVPFDQTAAAQTAEFATVSNALSLGDRACLVLAASRDAAAWTADRVWERMNLGVKLEMVR